MYMPIDVCFTTVVTKWYVFRKLINNEMLPLEPNFLYFLGDGELIEPVIKNGENVI